MAIIANLTEGQQIELEAVLHGFKKNNPEVLFKFFQQSKPLDLRKEIPQIQIELPPNDASLQEVSDKLDQLNRRLDMIFGDHILIDGKLTCVSNLIK